MGQPSSRDVDGGARADGAQGRIVRLLGAAALLDVLGAAVAMRNRELRGEPYGISCPADLPFPIEVIVWGSATSGPVALDVAAFAASRRLPGRRMGLALAALGSLRAIGVLGEPATWGRRRSRLAVLLAICHLAVAGELVRATMRGREGAASI
ncbi:MAG: hypothetical protein ACR2LQ_11640 [Acidimicrobiales bacterium]